MIELELELTFLAKEIPIEIKGATPKLLQDFYIPADAEHAQLRLRNKSGKYEITKKIPVSGTDSSAQNEHTIALTQEEFDALSSCSDKIVEKDRYNVTINGYPAEVDVFKGKLEGLVLIDFEFTSYEAQSAFVMPDKWAAGGVLSGKSYVDIEPVLAGYNYTKLSL
jgi:CYTH domain-containing protein